MDCKSCKEAQNLVQPVPLIVHETDMERLENANKRQFLIILVLVFLFVATNMAWIYYESQFEDVYTQTVEQDADNGTNNFVGGDYNGNTEGNNN